MKQKLERIKNLVKQGRLETAIKELTGILSANDLLNEAILQSGRLSMLQKDIWEGAVNWEDANTTHDSIMQAVLGLVKIAEEETEKVPQTKAGKASGTAINVTGEKNNIIGKVDGDVNITNN